MNLVSNGTDTEPIGGSWAARPGSPAGDCPGSVFSCSPPARRSSLVPSSLSHLEIGDRISGRTAADPHVKCAFLLHPGAGRAAPVAEIFRTQREVQGAAFARAT